MALTLGSLRTALSAALNRDETSAAATLGDLWCSGFLPIAEKAPVNATELVLTLLACLAGVAPEHAAAEAVRLGDFVLSGETELRPTPDGAIWRATPWPMACGTVMHALVSAITHIAEVGTPSKIVGVVPLRIRLQRGPQGDFLMMEWRRIADGATTGIYFAEPASARIRRPHSSMITTSDVSIDWALIEHLAEQLGPLSEPDNDSFAEVPVGREAALKDRADALDKREADIAAAHAQRSAELDVRQKALDARDQALKARAAAVAKAAADA